MSDRIYYHLKKLSAEVARNRLDRERLGAGDYSVNPAPPVTYIPALIRRIETNSDWRDGYDTHENGRYILKPQAEALRAELLRIDAAGAPTVDTWQQVIDAIQDQINTGNGVEKEGKIGASGLPDSGL